jgi:transcriptional antiterminator Rof (Rho-off)
MKLTFTLTDGTTFEAKNVKISDQIKVEYYDKEGKRVIRYITVTQNEKLVMQ